MTDQEIKKLAEEWEAAMHEKHETYFNEGYTCPIGGSYNEFWVCEKCESPVAGFIAGFKAGLVAAEGAREPNGLQTYTMPGAKPGSGLE